ncbi:MAG: LysR family transcriptional regulator [Hyphomicrobiales bacterium]|nr:LysR family transcriptional regulator [Hyphomicrobiales bacterium]
MDRLGSMSVLVAAVEAGSLSAAARRLGVPLTTVSRKVSELETHLGTRLLTRSSRKLTLTEAGRSYVEACKRILEDVNEAERAATGEYSAPRGELIVTAPIVFGRLHVIPVAVEFLKIYPEVDTRFVLTDGLINLLEDHVDVAVRIGELPDSSLVAIRIGAIRRVVCGSPRYFAERGIPKKPADLAGHDCITFEGLSSPDTWIFRTAGGQAPIPVHSRLVVNTASAAIDAAIAGFGITCVLSYQVADAIRAGTLAVVLEKFESAPWPISFVHSGQGLLPLKLRAFIDFATPRLKARLSKGMT